MRFRFGASPAKIATMSNIDSSTGEATASQETDHKNDAELSSTHRPGSKEFGVSTDVHSEDDEKAAVTKEFQHGVQAAEAMTQVWETKHLITAYIL